MKTMDWPEKVNTKISLDGNYSQEDGFVKTLRFANGKERTWQSNSYIPMKYPELSIMLDNKKIIDDNDKYNTEKKIFDFWFKVHLRNGILPFHFKQFEYPDNVAVYQFIPNSLTFDETDGIVKASFGLKEVAQMDGEIESNLWVTLLDQNASDELPLSGKVNKILQTISNFLKWIKELIKGGNTWLPPVNIKSELKTDNLNPKLNYLCKVVADPIQSGVYQLIAGIEEPTIDDWELFDSTVDLVNEQELESAINNHDLSQIAHGGVEVKFNEHKEDFDNPHEVTKVQVGLGNVDNTNDLNKPISNLTQTALNFKTDQADFELHLNDNDNPHNINNAQVGLSNVTNDAQVKRSEMGRSDIAPAAGSRVATLDPVLGTVPANQLPEGGGLLAVSRDNTLLGQGTPSSPMGLANITLTNAAASETLPSTGQIGVITQTIRNNLRRLFELVRFFPTNTSTENDRIMRHGEWAGGNFDLLTTPGFYNIRSKNVTRSPLNTVLIGIEGNPFPVEQSIVMTGTVKVLATSSSNVTQELTVFNRAGLGTNDTTMYYRSMEAGTWSNWVRVNGTGINYPSTQPPAEILTVTYSRHLYNSAGGCTDNQGTFPFIYQPVLVFTYSTTSAPGGSGNRNYAFQIGSNAQQRGLPGSFRSGSWFIDTVGAVHPTCGNWVTCTVKRWL